MYTKYNRDNVYIKLNKDSTITYDCTTTTKMTTFKTTSKKIKEQNQ
jgi:hypothetical protein